MTCGEDRATIIHYAKVLEEKYKTGASLEITVIISRRSPYLYLSESFFLFIFVFSSMTFCYALLLIK